MSKSKRAIAFAICALICLSLAAFCAVEARENNLEHVLSDIVKLPKTTTIAELEKAGYLNLSRIWPERSSKAADFFSLGGVPWQTVLKTVTEAEEGPMIRIFLRDRKTAIVYVYQCDVVNQRGTNHGLTFELQSEEVEGSDGTTEVWLRACMQDSSMPIHDDYLLYRYDS